MTYRGVLLGLALGLFIAGATFFNDFVVKQTMLVASHFPPAVFGVIAVIILGVNPLLRRFGAAAPLRPAELAVAAAIALAACGWPGSGFWRYAVTVPSMPAHWHRSAPAWQATGVMSYLPGGRGTLAEGQVADPAILARRIAAAADDPAADPVAAALWAALTPVEQGVLRAVAARTEPLSWTDVRTLLSAVNRALVRPDLFDPASLPAAVRPEGDPATAPGTHEVTRWNRSVLAAAWPDLIAPLPRGEGALLRGGRTEPHVIDALVGGRPGGEALMAPGAVPWGAWWPTLRLWVGLALLMGLASTCIALVVHPQWAQRELLAYPIPRLVEELGRRSGDRGLPDIARSPLFWAALLAVLAIRSINGLNAWFPEVPTVPLRFNFNGFASLFPNAYRVPLQFGVFHPSIFLSVVGFAFFIPTSASLSLGLVPVVWVVFGAFLLGQGIPLDYSKHEPSRANFLRFGAYLAMVVMIVYTGRRYYLDVLRGSLGLGTAGATPRYAIWAARALPPLLLGAVLLLHSAGMEPWVASLTIAVIVVAWLVLNRIICETGLFFVSVPFIAGVIVEGLVGFEALGPTGLLLVGMTTWIIIADPREALMPYIGNALAIVDRAGGGPGVVGKVAPWIVGMVVASLLVAGFVTMSMQYEHGVMSMNNPYAAHDVPKLPFDRVAYHVGEASALGTLTEATTGSAWERLGSIEPVPGLLVWAVGGFAIVLLTASARLRLPWFPIHPVLFLVWGTYAATYFGMSFLIGCVIKTLVLRIGGAQAYAHARPLMVGLIVGELLGALLWMVVGAQYYLIHGLTPAGYSVFPG